MCICCAHKGQDERVYRIREARREKVSGGRGEGAGMQRGVSLKCHLSYAVCSITVLKVLHKLYDKGFTFTNN